MTLPPMPTGHTIGCGIFNGQKLFTADQMRAYAEQAVAAERERCAHPPQQRKPPREQITAAAKALCRRASIACNVDFDDNWKVYGDEYIADATAALNAAYGIGEPT